MAKWKVTTTTTRPIKMTVVKLRDDEKSPVAAPCAIAGACQYGDQWQPIESCPRDGEPFIGGYYFADTDEWFYGVAYWHLTDKYHPDGYLVMRGGGGGATHWFRPPMPPKRTLVPPKRRKAR